MDPCPFVQLIIESLAIKLPFSTKPAGSRIHPSTTPCYAKFKIKNFNSQITHLPLYTSTGNETVNENPPSDSSVVFILDPDALRRISIKQVVNIKVSVFRGSMGRTCVMTSGKLLGSIQVSVNLGEACSRGCVYQNGWMKVGETGTEEMMVSLHMMVRSEPDPRFVFQFGGEPECSPVVFQIQGNSIKQPVFSCKFTAERNNRTRSIHSDSSKNRIAFMSAFPCFNDKIGRERKGWMITIYDLSGTAVAAASMVTPFVASPNSDYVSHSNPGSWLILCPNGISISSWKPWGRLSAWRERGQVDGLGYKFERITEDGLTSVIPIAQGTISVKKGGKFFIDNSSNRGIFVMGSSVEGEGKVSKPVVEVGAIHVSCMTDAALFVAVSAAIDLSMDACRLFSDKLRKEFN